MKIEFFDNDDKSADPEPLLVVENWRGPTPDIGDVVTVGDQVFETHEREIVADKTGLVTAVQLSVDEHDAD